MSESTELFLHRAEGIGILTDGISVIFFKFFPIGRVSKLKKINIGQT